MKQFTSTLNQKYKFSSCEICDAKCCDGKRGTTFTQIVREEFSIVYKNFPILFIFGELGYLKPVVLLTNGNDFCKYLKDFKCTIYELRPSTCRVYPLSPNLDNNIYIDELCPAVEKTKDKNNLMVNNSIVTKDYDNPILHNYQDKYIDTHKELEVFNKKDDFIKAVEISGIEFFKYKKTSENIYMKMHQKSLIHLQNKYFTN